MDSSYLLSVSLPLVSGVFAVTFFCLWLMQKTQPYILDWFLACLCGLIGSATGLIRIFLNETAWFSFVGNGFLVGMAYFACRGAILRHIGRPLDHLLLPILIITLVTGIWFGFVYPSIFARGTASSLGAAAMFVIAAGAILKTNDRDIVGILIAVAFYITAAMLAGRPITIYFFGSTISSEAEVIGSWWGVSFRFLAIFSIVSGGILFLHRIASDLLDRIKGQANRDYLTGVLNRGGFFSTIGSHEAYESYAVIICDIDQFKYVNDSYGHKVGDTVIQSLAKVLTDAARPFGYIVGRLGGDEFAIMLPGADAGVAQEFAEQICKSFAAFTHRGIAQTDRITISAGAGITLGNASIDTVLEHADIALYRAKHKGKNCSEVVVLPLLDRSSSISSMYRRRQRA